MVALVCPKCKSKLEISDFKQEDHDKTAVFCSNEKCAYYKQPLIGMDRKTGEVFLSESLV